MAEYYGKAFAEEPELYEIKSDFKDYVLEWEKKYGGAGQAASYAEEWYENALADPTAVDTRLGYLFAPLGIVLL